MQVKHTSEIFSVFHEFQYPENIRLKILPPHTPTLHPPAAPGPPQHAIPARASVPASAGGGVVFVCVRMGAFLYKILCYMIAQGGQKRAFDSLEVELQLVVSCSVSARN